MQKEKRNKQQAGGVIFQNNDKWRVSVCRCCFFLKFAHYCSFRSISFRNFPLRVEIREAHKAFLIPIHKIPIFYHDMQETRLDGIIPFEN